MRNGPRLSNPGASLRRSLRDVVSARSNAPITEIQFPTTGVQVFAVAGRITLFQEDTGAGIPLAYQCDRQ